MSRQKWTRIDGSDRSQRLRVKHADAVVWKNGPESWVVSMMLGAPTEDEAKALAERLVREAKP